MSHQRLENKGENQTADQRNSPPNFTSNGRACHYVRQKIPRARVSVTPPGSRLCRSIEQKTRCIIGIFCSAIRARFCTDTPLLWKSFTPASEICQADVQAPYAWFNKRTSCCGNGMSILRSQELIDNRLIDFGAGRTKITDRLYPGFDGDDDGRISQIGNAHHRFEFFQHARVRFQDLVNGEQRLTQICGIGDSDRRINRAAG